SDQPGLCGVRVGLEPWKAQVEKLFKHLHERYQCHYEVDPCMLQSLLQRSTLGSEDVRGGLQVVVCQGDITKEWADALVNSANQDLDHAGGVAAALSQAGGPEVQRASIDLVRQIGRVPTGTVVETTGGKLPCMMLLHAVGPVGGGVGGNERPLLEKTVKAALVLAETLELQTLAMPCISSGIFSVPLKVCSEAIVSAVKDFGREQRILTKVTLIDVSGCPGVPHGW
uniref:Macro domain-containing protein n=1 Tax=Salmo trutta TaxID=8032 RepID=A0A674A450_SALTR